MSQEKPDGVIISIQDAGVVLDPAFQLDAKEDISGLQNFLPGEYPYSNLFLKAMNQKLEDIEETAGDYKGVLARKYVSQPCSWHYCQSRSQTPH